MSSCHKSTTIQWEPIRPDEVNETDTSTSNGHGYVECSVLSMPSGKILEIYIVWSILSVTTNYSFW